MSAEFVLLRPLWLLALLPVLLLGLLLQRYTDPSRRWRGVLAPHLLPHLLGQSGRDSRLPERLLTGALLLSVIALCGPSWRTEPTPFAEESPPAVILLEVTPEMLATDLAPSRLQRAILELEDLLSLRPGARHALVAFAGSAHVVLPWTRDARALLLFAGELGPEVLPRQGFELGEALRVARDLLERGRRGGAILVASGSLTADRLRAVEHEGAPVELLLLRPGAGDADLARAAARLGGSLTLLDAGDADSRRLAGRLARAPAPPGDEVGAQRRQDGGFLLVPLIVLLALPWARRGWSLRWSGSSSGLALVCLLVLGGCGDDIWSRPERRGLRLLEQGRADEAVELFRDPMWRGVALFRAGRFEEAAWSFALVDGPDGHYDRGVALVFLGNYDGAIEAFDAALELRPRWQEARENRELAARRLAALQFEAGDMTGGKLGADDVVFDGSDTSGAQGEIELGEGALLDDASTRELWLRRVETRPADFLRWKFAFQLATRGEGDG